MPAFTPVTLGRTGLQVGRLGIGSSYGVSARAVEAAWERGCSYLYWGSLRRRGFSRALRHLCRRDRDGVVLVVQTFSRLGAFVAPSLHRALRRAGTDHADVLLLGMFSKRPPRGVLDAALALQERGLVRSLGLSTHHRPYAAELLQADGPIDVVHVRYNAAHRGAEAEVFPHARPTQGPGLVAFTATRWGTLLKPLVGGAAEPPPPSAADCYRFVLSHPAVHTCITAPASDAEMAAALEALDHGPLDPDELERIRRHGDRVYAAPPRRATGLSTLLTRRR